MRMGKIPFTILLFLSSCEARHGQGQATFVFGQSRKRVESSSFRRSLPQGLQVTKHPLDELATDVDDEEEQGGTSAFYDIEHFEDDYDSSEEKRNAPDAASPLSDFERDEDDILTELEDRFFVDENGHRRKVEKCILVGVEDLSAKRKLQKKIRNGCSHDTGEEDMLFTLEESLSEMRELIKTAGMECVGGEH